MASCYKGAQAYGYLGSGKSKFHGKGSLKGRGEKTDSSSDPRERELKEGVTNGAQTLQYVIITTIYTVSLTHPYGWRAASVKH